MCGDSLPTGVKLAERGEAEDVDIVIDLGDKTTMQVPRNERVVGDT